MADLVRVRPMLELMPCRVRRPEKVFPAPDNAVEKGEGAIGLGVQELPDGSRMLFISMHTPDGDVLMANLGEDEFDTFGTLLNMKVADLASDELPRLN